MGALIYDSASGAFKDAETPKVYSNGAFADSEGKVYENGEWVDGWGVNNILWIVKQGHIMLPYYTNTVYSGKWGTNVPNNITDITFGDGYVDITSYNSTNGGGTGMISLEQLIDMSLYSNLYIKYDILNAFDDTGGDVAWATIHMYFGRSYSRTADEGTFNTDINYGVTDDNMYGNSMPSESISYIKNNPKTLAYLYFGTRDWHRGDSTSKIRIYDYYFIKD